MTTAASELRELLDQHAPDFIPLWPERQPQRLLCRDCGRVADRECPVRLDGNGPLKNPMGCIPAGDGDPDHQEDVERFYRWKRGELVPVPPGTRVDPLLKFQLGCPCGWRSPVFDAPDGSGGAAIAPAGAGGYRRLFAVWAAHMSAPGM